MNSTKSMSILITDDRCRVNCSKNKMWLAPAACRCQKNMDRKGERESEIKNSLTAPLKSFHFAWTPEKSRGCWLKWTFMQIIMRSSKDLMYTKIRLNFKIFEIKRSFLSAVGQFKLKKNHRFTSPCNLRSLAGGCSYVRNKKLGASHFDITCKLARKTIRIS